MSDQKHEMVESPDVLPAKTVLHPAVAQVLANNPTPEALEKIVALQERWEAGEAKRAYTRAIVGLRKDLPTWIERDQVVDFTTAKGRVRYTHVSLAAAMEAVLPALTAHGFNLWWKPARTDKGEVSVTANLTHREGHTESATLFAPVDSSGSKSASQGVASTVTLLQRYTALSILGIATADMKDPKPLDEPTDPEQVDTQRNMRAMAALVRTGKTKEEIEKYVGRPVGEWTAEDVQKLRDWFKAGKAPAPAAAEAEQHPTTIGELDEGQTEELFGFMGHHAISRPEMLEILEQLVPGQELTSGNKITKEHFGKLRIKMDQIKRGEATIMRDQGPMRIEKIPDSVPGDADIPF